MRAARKLLPPPIPVLLLIALALRVLMAGTWAGFHYPDEWFQSAEFANLLVHGQATYSQEVGLHLRNLMWPSILALPLVLAHTLAPDLLWAKLFSLQATAAALDFLMLLGLLAMARRRGWEKRAQIILVALAGLSWFAVQFSVKLSGEHAAAVFTVLSLALLEVPHGRRRAKPAWLCAGALAMLAFAAKYPAGLFGAGMLLALLARKDWPRLKLWSFGAGLGLIAISLPDAFQYGRPLESLWMYLAYNVLTPTAAAMFGAQPLTEYLGFFKTRWFNPAFFVGLALVPALLAGWGRGLRRMEPWAVAAMTYLLPHLLIAHKEERFLLPLEPLWIFAATPMLLWGWNQVAGVWPRRILALFLIVGAAQTLVVARGHWGTLQGSYLQADRHLKTHQNACLVITARPPVVALLPRKVPVAHFNALRHQSMSDQITTAQLTYWQSPPSCADGQEILLNVETFELGWENWGCTRLLHQPLANLGLKGVWYGCPHTMVRLFTHQKTEAPIVTSFGHLESLPGPSALREMKPVDLLRLGDRNVPPPECAESCFRRGRDPADDSR